VTVPHLLLTVGMSGKTVETVRGPLPVAGLGTALMHEHLFMVNEEVALGVSKIDDPTVVGLGRDVARAAIVNAQLDINIVAATGLNTLSDAPLMLRYHSLDTLLVRGRAEGTRHKAISEQQGGIR
jgi:phosphotriesterase-related protein